MIANWIAADGHQRATRRDAFPLRLPFSARSGKCHAGRWPLRRIRVGSPPHVDQPVKTPDYEQGEQGNPRRSIVPWAPDLQFSSPLPGLPRVWWRHGSTPEIIIEMRLDAEDQQYPPFLATLLSEFKRIVIYHRERPYIRVIFDLGELVFSFIKIYPD